MASFVSQHESGSVIDRYLSMVGAITTGANPSAAVTSPTAGSDTIPLKGSATYNHITVSSLSAWIGQQTHSSVDIDGGTIDNAIIGGSTPAAGTFTSLAATGNITVTGTVDGVDIATFKSAYDAHAANTSNPHGVTPAQLSLGAADSVSFDSVTATGNGRFNRMAIGDDISPNPLIGNNIRIFVTDPASYGGAAGSDISLYDTSTGNNDHGNSGLWVQGIYQSDYDNIGGWSRGLFVRSALTRSGSLSTLRGIEIQYGPDEAGGTGTVTTAVGLEITAKNVAGTIDTGYGILIHEVFGTAKYAIYQEGASDPNFFAGPTAFGSRINGSTDLGYLSLFGDAEATNSVRIHDDGGVSLVTGAVLSWVSTANVYIQESSGALFAGTNGGFVFKLDTSRNFLLGTTDTPTDATKTLVIGNGVAPTGNPTDSSALYSASARLTERSGDGSTRYMYGATDAPTFAGLTLTGNLVTGAQSGVQFGSVSDRLYRSSSNIVLQNSGVTVQTWTSTGTTLAGTLSGTSASFSSSVLATAYTAVNAAASNTFLSSKVTADVNDRFIVTTGGTLKWGSGSAADDTNLYRNGVGVLKTDSAFTAASYTNGVGSFEISGSNFQGVSTGPALINTAPSATVATVLANQTDGNTGLGHAGSDQLSLIAGGVEGIRITEAGSVITAIALNGPAAVTGNLTVSGTSATLATGAVLSWVSGANAYLQESSGVLYIGTNGGSAVAIDTSRNVLIGTTTSPASATKALVIGNGVAPTGSVADAMAIYSVDRSAGNTMLGLRGEGTMLLAGVPAAASGAIPMEINGTTVYLTYSTTAPS